MGLRLFGIPEATIEPIMPHKEQTSQLDSKPQVEEQQQEQQQPPRRQSPRYHFPASPSMMRTRTGGSYDGISTPAPVSSLAHALPTTLNEVHQRYIQTFSSATQPRGAGANTGAGVTRPKTEAELAADRMYEEAMEEEYEKREGGC